MGHIDFITEWIFLFGVTRHILEIQICFSSLSTNDKLSKLHNQIFWLRYFSFFPLITFYNVLLFFFCIISGYFSFLYTDFFFFFFFFFFFLLIKVI